MGVHVTLVTCNSNSEQSTVQRRVVVSIGKGENYMKTGVGYIGG